MLLITLTLNLLLLLDQVLGLMYELHNVFMCYEFGLFYLAPSHRPSSVAMATPNVT